TFEVSGVGRLLGVDNGDLRCHEPNNGNSHTTYFGRAQLIIQSTRRTGVITVKATADGLDESVLTIISK
ncbi:MAG: hypothetical protein LBR06_10440, partial [Bacteroidales bacterium]|nr:hypothetical protein [Bacteroidales bacterium]